MKRHKDERSFEDDEDIEVSLDWNVSFGITEDRETKKEKRTTPGWNGHPQKDALQRADRASFQDKPAAQHRVRNKSTARNALRGSGPACATKTPPRKKSTGRSACALRRRRQEAEAGEIGGRAQPGLAVLLKQKRPGRSRGALLNGKSVSHEGGKRKGILRVRQFPVSGQTTNRLGLRTQPRRDRSHRRACEFSGIGSGDFPNESNTLARAPPQTAHVLRI